MLRIIAALFALATATSSPSPSGPQPQCDAITLPKIYPQNSCVSLTVGQGTGCSWMCTYCAGALGTNNYYFTDGVCTYQSGGCVGNPQAGVTYTCCAV